jgi:hypothetical protein
MDSPVLVGEPAPKIDDRLLASRSACDILKTFGWPISLTVRRRPAFFDN